MDTDKLEHIAKMMVAHGKGLLDADESNASCQARFESVGIPCTENTRREYRQLLLTTPGAEQYASAVSLSDEAFWQSGTDGRAFRVTTKKCGIIPVIKVDKGLVDLPGFPGEKVTQGLDGLPERMKAYAAGGAECALWRSVLNVGDGRPTDECVGSNTFVLSRYARICQDAGLVPIVEFEILPEGSYSIEECERVLAHALDILFQTMRAFRVHLPGAILKVGMVLPGKDSGHDIDHNEVAERTLRTLYEHVPHELGGVLLLDGGQAPRDALINLNRIAHHGQQPWGVAFAYARALDDEVLRAWAHDRHAAHDLQKLFLRQLELASAANKGELDESQLDADSYVSPGHDLQ